MAQNKPWIFFFFIESHMTQIFPPKVFHQRDSSACAIRTCPVFSARSIVVHHSTSSLKKKKRSFPAELVKRASSSLLQRQPAPCYHRHFIRDSRLGSPLNQDPGISWWVAVTGLWPPSSSVLKLLPVPLNDCSLPIRPLSAQTGDVLCAALLDPCLPITVLLKCQWLFSPVAQSVLGPAVGEARV